MPDYTGFFCTAEPCRAHATVSIETNLLCDAHAARCLAAILRELSAEHTPGGAALLSQAADLLERVTTPSVTSPAARNDTDQEKDHG